jgi:hypothetical protein
MYWIAWGIVASHEMRTARRTHGNPFAIGSYPVGTGRRSTRHAGSRSGGSRSGGGGGSTGFSTGVDKTPQGYSVKGDEAVTPSSWVDHDPVYDAERDDTIDAEVVGENVDVEDIGHFYDIDTVDGEIEDDDYGFEQADDSPEIVVEADNGDRVG